VSTPTPTPATPQPRGRTSPCRAAISFCAEQLLIGCRSPGRSRGRVRAAPALRRSASGPLRGLRVSALGAPKFADAATRGSCPCRDGMHPNDEREGAGGDLTHRSQWRRRSPAPSAHAEAQLGLACGALVLEVPPPEAAGTPVGKGTSEVRGSADEPTRPSRGNRRHEADRMTDGSSNREGSSIGRSSEFNLCRVLMSIRLTRASIRIERRDDVHRRSRRGTVTADVSDRGPPAASGRAP
jgi:hypothetical protein